MELELIWNDGGRAACGYVGTTGDCVTRSIAIATGTAYREVYDELGEKSLKTPRDGVAVQFAAEYLRELGWTKHSGELSGFAKENLPPRRVICYLQKESGGGHHFSSVIDGTVHDTWNPSDDEYYVIHEYWTPPEQEQSDAMVVSSRHVSDSQKLSQQEFDKVMRRLRALDNTANNDASTEGEKRNALRMMQSLMLTHNLTQDDLEEKEDCHTQLARIACPVNGRRVCTWEVMLAYYVTQHVFPAVQFFRATRQHRSMFWFYGPVQDVENSIALFRELMLTIAAAAKLQYGGYSRGSGASYAEGYVAGLPRAFEEELGSSPTNREVEESDQMGLIHQRMLAIHAASREWLAAECGIRLVAGSGRGRYAHDPNAAGLGKQHGSKHQVNTHGRRKGIGYRAG